MTENRIPVTGLSTLELSGLRVIPGAHLKISFLPCKDFESFAQACAPHCPMIVSEDVFLSHLDFFIQRKQRLIIISRMESSCFHKEQNDFNFIFKDSTETEIAGIVESVLNDIAPGRDKNGVLSAREIEVVRCVASGLTSKETADRLCISLNTVLTHRKNISAKLGIRSASGISLYAAMNGLI